MGLKKKRRTVKKTTKKPLVRPQNKNLKRTAGPGRPKGSKNKATVEAKAACSEIVDDPIYRQNLKKRAQEGRLQPGLEAMLWYYAKGKPKELIEHTLEEGTELKFTIKIDDNGNGNHNSDV
jgi:hypothetical protein